MIFLLSLVLGILSACIFMMIGDNRMNIYMQNGFLDIKKIIDFHTPFNFIVGGRGIGKSYGALKYAYENNIKFVLLRRTQSQVDIISKPEFQPFKALNTDNGWNVGVKSVSKNHSAFYNMETDEKGVQYAVGAPIGYIMAISTISNIRGFDASDIDLIIYDEFIPERHERPIKNEGAAFLNAYETINRNRELKGLDPVTVLALANANDLGNPIFMELKIISKAEKMRLKNQEYSIDQNRGISIFILTQSPISEAKANTALYKATSGSDFSDMAIDNNFEELKNISVKPQPLNEYKPIVTLGEITFYKHKSKKQYYCSTHRTGDPKEFGVSETELKRFWRAYYFLWEAYMRNIIIFEDATCEILLTKYSS